MLSQFARAERIRQAFFPPDSSTPSVSFTVTMVRNSGTVESTVINMSGRQVQLFLNSTGASFTWPDDTADILIVLFPQSETTENALRFGGGRWALSEFIARGRNSTSGTQADVTHQAGGRSVTLRLEFDSIAIPFLMRELSDFSCPTTIE